MNQYPLLVINLNERKNRLISCENELNKISLPIEIIKINTCDAIEAKKNAYTYISYNSYKNLTETLFSTKVLPTWGAVGCAISHIRCWEYIAKNNLDFAFICEDDIHIKDEIKFNFKMMQCINYHKKNLIDNIHINSMVNLPLIFFFSNEYNNQNLTSSRKLTSNPTMGTDIKRVYEFINQIHFYSLNKVLAEILLAIILPITYQIDID